MTSSVNNLIWQLSPTPTAEPQAGATQDDLTQAFEALSSGGINFFDTAEVSQPIQHHLLHGL